MQKKEIIEAINLLLKERIETLKAGIESARETANSESKSSAGDKYETTRAMMHLEIEKLSNRLAEATRLFVLNEHASIAKPSGKVGLGSFVLLNKQWYFFGAGLGKITVNNQTLFAVSLNAPIGQLLKDKIVGDQIEFNGKMLSIERIV